jgi:hypothetical protein
VFENPIGSTSNILLPGHAIPSCFGHEEVDKIQYFVCRSSSMRLSDASAVLSDFTIGLCIPRAIISRTSLLRIPKGIAENRLVESFVKGIAENRLVESFVKYFEGAEGIMKTTQLLDLPPYAPKTQQD